MEPRASEGGAVRSSSAKTSKSFTGNPYHWKVFEMGLILTFAVALALALPHPSRGGSLSAGTAKVKIFMAHGKSTSNCARVSSAKRTVKTPGVLAGAMRALLAGQTSAEKKNGYHGWFTRKTTGYLRKAHIAKKIAYIDFRNFSKIIPNASTSCGSALLLAQLNRTATQFAGVNRAIYSFNGSSKAFYAWLQRDVPKR